MTPKMIPGQDPYTADELDALYALVADAAEGDPGERDEPPDERWDGWTNYATWYVSLIIHNEHALYRSLHDPWRLAALRERPTTLDVAAGPDHGRVARSAHT